MHPGQLEEGHARVRAGEVNQDLVVQRLVDLLVPRPIVLLYEALVLNTLALECRVSPLLVGRQIAL